MVSNIMSINKQEKLKNYKNLNEIKKKSGTMLHLSPTYRYLTEMEK